MPQRVTGTAPRPQVQRSPQQTPATRTASGPAGSASWAPRTGRPQARNDGFAAPRVQVDTGNVQLDRIANARLGTGKDHSCVTVVRSNLRKLGFEGLPVSTGQDGNNPRGMMVQMIQSGHWQTPSLPDSTQTTIKSPYGTVEVNTLSREAFLAAAEAGQVPQGALVFQTQHGWDYNKGSLGNDVGIVQGDHVHNYKPMKGLTVYGPATRDIVVMLPA